MSGLQNALVIAALFVSEKILLLSTSLSLSLTLHFHGGYNPRSAISGSATGDALLGISSYFYQYTV